VDAVGHRVVHGGSRFVASIRIEPGVIAEIERLNDLAPLHNPACLAGIRASQAVLGPSVPMVAVFDTAFHRTLPDHAATYALPRELASKHRIRRYGFHGIAHASLADGYAALACRPLDEVRLIALHLGNGCSATAIRHGRSVDTSMGFTPLEGLVMGTRCGDLDASVVGFLAKREGAPLDDVDRWLNERSGLLGVSGLTHDMRELLIAAGQRRDADAESAIALFCYRVRKYIGAYLAVLGGADAIVFGGGIGERSPEIRARICEGMDWCGLVLDQERNLKARDFPPGGGACISPDDAPLPAYVVAVDEETAIARDTMRCLEGEEAS
jgi:acetate kinase